uniref:Nose resistant-to-fluoxetine protein N-terminal domain-containing protein n=1 Tax=Timema genevievae TaxID=629358 RepID=A0A7R9K4U5_TIMGE|nr:unnamed protein product [Timema genevievae]
MTTDKGTTTTSNNPLEQFVLLAKSAKGAAAVELIKQVLEAPGVHVFGELLDMPNVLELENGPHSNYLQVLHLFAYGTYRQYLDNRTQLPELSPAQKKKLQHLTIVTLATKTKARMNKRNQHMFVMFVLTFINVSCIADQSTNYEQVFETIDVMSKFIQGFNVSLTNETNCKQDLNLYFTSLKSRSSSWAIAMFDASTKFPQGIFSGYTHHLGNFDECIGIVAQTVDEDRKFNGKHCLVTLTLNNSGETTKNVVWSVCVPSSCKVSELRDILSNILPEGVSINIDKNNCSVNEGISLEPRDWIVVLVLGLFLMLVIVCTTYDVIVRENKKEIYTYFSVYTNGKRLLDLTKGEDSLTVLFGIRFISCGWVLLGQRYAYNLGIPATNPDAIADSLQNWSKMHIVNSGLASDTFLLSSGLLISYRFLKAVNTTNTFNLPLFYLHRLVRLIPAYAAVLMVQATLLNYAATGPLSHSASELTRGRCKTTWWTHLLFINNYLHSDKQVHLLFINNYLHSDKQCLEQCWYLAVDTQLFLLSPLLLYPMWKWSSKYVYVIIATLTTLGIAVTFVVAYVYKFPVNYLQLDEASLADYLWMLYYPTHTRYTPWTIGLCLGYILHQTHGRQLNMTTSSILLGWLVSNICMIGVVLGLTPFQQSDYVYGRLESSLYYAIFRPGWSIGVAWIIFACDAGYGGITNKLLSWTIFLPLSRLTYCMYLVAVPLLNMRANSIKFERYIQDSDIIPAFMGDLMYTAAIAVIVSFMFEVPLVRIEDMFTTKGRRNIKHSSSLLERDNIVLDRR